MNFKKNIKYILIGLVFNIVFILNITGLGDPKMGTLYANSHSSASNLGYYIQNINSYIDMDHEVLPGAVILVLIPVKKNNEILMGASFIFRKDKEKKLYTVPILRYDAKNFYALLPVSYDIDEGQYLVSLDIDSERVDTKKAIPQEASFVVKVGKRGFYKEDVVLNYNLAKRKSQPASPKVVAEAKEIWELTGTVNEDSLYEIAELSFPLEMYKYVTGMFADQRIYTYADGKKIASVKHGGIDIAAITGTPVYAGATGRVVLAKERIVTGNSVVVEHYPGMYTMYYHLDSIAVKKGQLILKGAKLGEVGNSGFSTGPHLHWEMRVNNVRVDPLYSQGKLDNIKTLIIKYK